MGSQLGSAGLLLVNTLINIYLLMLMMRFLLQASRADYYNPISQSVVKVTQPVVRPFQGFLRPVGRFDLATLAATQAIEYLCAPVKLVTSPHTPVPFSPALEDTYIPTPERIATAVRETMMY